MSWITVSPTSHFPIQNLPFGIFSTVTNSYRRAGVAIGDFVLDLFALSNHGLLDDLGFPSQMFGEPTLNSFMELERPAWRATRQRIHSLLSIENSDKRLSSNEALKAKALIPVSEAIMHMPAKIGDYTDFYSSREHATNVGIMFRGVDNALQPNWLHLPVGYHGRSSSVVISGTDVVRPQGQLQADKDDPKKGSIFGACRLLDFELEMGIFLGGQGNPLGRPLTIAEAEDKIFGFVILNDWSARDIQAWEYVPLGPFTAKNFATSISPWIVTLDALEPFRCTTSAGEVQTDPEPLPYLRDPDYARSSYDIRLEVAIRPTGDATPSTISVSNLRHMYWNAKQQLVHHSVTGCNMAAADLLGTGTISGTTPDSLGSMLELSWRGSREVVLNNSVGAEGRPAIRKFLQDGDEVTMTGFAQGDGYRVGFGSVAGRILPTGSAPLSPPVPPSPPLPRFRLFSYWRSSSSYRVRIALNLKGLAYEYVPVDLLPLVGNVTQRLPEDFRESVNLMEQIPVLEVLRASDGALEARLTQSVAIIEYIDETIGGSTKLLPGDPMLRCRARQIAEIINAGIQPLQNVSILRQVKTVELVGHEGETVGSKEFAAEAIRKGLNALEALLKEYSPLDSELFAAGTTAPTVADIFLVPQIYAARRFGIDVNASYPHVAAVANRCATLPAFKQAEPEAQPDFVPQ